MFKIKASNLGKVLVVSLSTENPALKRLLLLFFLSTSSFHWVHMFAYSLTINFSENDSETF